MRMFCAVRNVLSEEFISYSFLRYSLELDNW